MRHPSGEIADRLKLLRLHQLFARLPAGLDLPGQRIVGGAQVGGTLGDAALDSPPVDLLASQICPQESGQHEDPGRKRPCSGRAQGGERGRSEIEDQHPLLPEHID